ncbi:hypothetical protein PF005_g20331 [Phytophthora fragariae]|uniref:Uncharacterized protein n=1 Tax=Phytophthora fragariae TaxID=53985 RepID=A0A6A3SHL7_9STRA|nr:hypothetical protein PF007_g20402 [Phytophthora fragariae]KAE9116760.1 hypothetical protein PF006_g18965 [Phytophthora fragariae]KAE9187744.1 hypothetical protein PF005_g20331 [Phytophthora fragariae]KAE9199744.1 hypothetical protein PF004_g19187 [Phytophthora fragariae]
MRRVTTILGTRANSTSMSFLAFGVKLNDKASHSSVRSRWFRHVEIALSQKRSTARAAGEPHTMELRASAY